MNSLGIIQFNENSYKNLNLNSAGNSINVIFLILFVSIKNHTSTNQNKFQRAKKGIKYN